ncbi:MAG: hypothetical protein IPH66_15930 [Crocinitomicaceae bacterium]|nr:hypothetical protein [Crocinitomicaceae bacterium]
MILILSIISNIGTTQSDRGYPEYDNSEIEEEMTDRELAVYLTENAKKKKKRQWIWFGLIAGGLIVAYTVQSFKKNNR